MITESMYGELFFSVYIYYNLMIGNYVQCICYISAVVSVICNCKYYNNYLLQSNICN